MLDMLFRTSSLTLLALALSLPGQAAAASFRLVIQGTDCELCVQLAKGSIGQLKGVSSVWIAPDKTRLVVELQPGALVDPEAVILLTRRSGYAVKSLQHLQD